VWADDISVEWPAGTRFTIHAGAQTRALQTRLIGKHMVYAILAAVAVALTEGFTLDEIIPALEAVAPVPGRMETVRLGSGATVLRDDFKSAVETIDTALDALGEIPARRTIVIGEIAEPPGSAGPIYRRLGARTAGIASRVVFVGRSGAWKPFRQGAKRAGFPREQLIYAGETLRSVFEALPPNFGPEDVVLVKGRDTQRLERVTLALTGRAVGCDIGLCNAKVRCEICPMLERGWSETAN
jgi:UDP-N-acetylmuramyl pentapeptide synthase